MTPLPIDERRITKLCQEAERLEDRITDLTIEEIADLSAIYKRMADACNLALANAKAAAE